ncbi:MAG: hypothetical protein AUG49_07070 [Catenulispora sp. 13_1_20CM_3_70_7]|nr:MAG: hypothetical protein AUG49_07070 [Catenulispora sp. 13_1_20CM_3_70_7]
MLGLTPGRKKIPPGVSVCVCATTAADAEAGSAAARPPAIASVDKAREVMRRRRTMDDPH